MFGKKKRSANELQPHALDDQGVEKQVRVEVGRHEETRVAARGPKKPRAADGRAARSMSLGSKVTRLSNRRADPQPGVMVGASEQNQREAEPVDSDPNWRSQRVVKSGNIFFIGEAAAHLTDEEVRATTIPVPGLYKKLFAFKAEEEAREALHEPTDREIFMDPIGNMMGLYANRRKNVSPIEDSRDDEMKTVMRAQSDESHE